jgi:hypothetical protein
MEDLPLLALQNTLMCCSRSPDLRHLTITVDFALRHFLLRLEPTDVAALIPFRPVDRLPFFA